MKNKILKLVLNKNCSKKSIILNKKEGNITSLIAGLLFLTIIIIIAMFNFRVTMLSEVFYNIDDALTASTLGAATPNTDAYMYNTKEDNGVTHIYPEQGQIVLQDALDESSYVNYKQGGATGSGEYNEQKVVLSELNSNLINNGRYDAARVTNTSNISTLADAAALTRLGYTSEFNTDNEFQSYINYKKKVRNIDMTDKYALKTVNNLLDVTYTNFTQNLIAAPKVTSLATVGDNFTISKNNVLDKAFLGNYLNSDIKITRLEMYNVYRYTLAERHVYASPYMTYTVNNVPGYTWDGYNADGTKSTAPNITLNKPIVLDDKEINEVNAVKYMINNTAMGSSGKTAGIDISADIDWNGPTTESEFRELMSELYPAMIVPGKEPDWFKLANPDLDYDKDPYNPVYNMYNLMKTLWEVDLKAWNDKGTYPLIFWEDTGITYQTSWWSDSNSLKNTYGYLWNNNSAKPIEITDNILVKDDSNRLLLPIEGYSIYAYVGNSVMSSPSNNYYNLSDLADSTNGVLSKKLTHVKLGDTNGDGVADDALSGGIVYRNRKKDADICYTGVYMEVAFDVIMFPNNSTDENTSDSFLNLAEFSTQPVTQARLVTITKNDAEKGGT